MLVDMHLHALPNSTDSFLTLEEIVSLAKLRGLDAICLTDHDSMGGKEYATKLRIKDVVELADDSFVKINQGCVANVKRIKKFKVSFGGALRVIFEDGYSDYVSRRELPNVKRRLGL